MTFHRWSVPVLALGVLLAGCVSPGAPEAFVVRPAAEDSQAVITVDSVPAGLRYQDVLILVGDQPFRLGPRLDASAGWYAVEGKAHPGSPVAVGDQIRVPASGEKDFEMRHATSAARLAAFHLRIADHSAPAAPMNMEPLQGAMASARNPQFAWTAVSDPSGISYTLEYWAAAAGQPTPPVVVTGLTGPSYVPPSSKLLLPAQTYQWHVRAVDGLGNGSPWTDTWEFTTGL